MYTRSYTHRHKSCDYTIHPVFDERAVPTPRCVSIRIGFIFHSHSTRHTSTPTPIRRRDARERIQTTHAYRPVTTNDGIRGRARTHSFHFVRVKFKKRVRAASEEEGGPPVDFEFKREVRTSARARARARSVAEETADGVPRRSSSSGPSLKRSTGANERSFGCILKASETSLLAGEFKCQLLDAFRRRLTTRFVRDRVRRRRKR